MPTIDRTILGCVLLGLFASGCGRVAELVHDKAEAAAAVAATAGMSDDDKMARKLGGYAHCVDFTAKGVHRAADRYYGWADAVAGPTGHEKRVHGTFEVLEDPTCFEGIERANAMEPADEELESAAIEFADAYEAARETINEAYAYYGGRAFENDGFAQGRALHPRLAEVFSRFDEADDALRHAVDDRTDVLLERELEQLEAEDGRSLRFQNKNVVARAKDLTRAATGDAFDLATFESTLAEFDAALSECAAYVGEHPEETRSVPFFDPFLEDGGELRSSARRLARRRREGKPYTNTEQMHIDNGNAVLVDGTPASVVEAYNDLVNRSNRLGWHAHRVS